ncbi:hypothetical protein [Streptomyces paradoxus]|uniref:Uncharacterized protein n=1 Tax=Streptomyces paradoxus TaxID=66375 RepID=A0A7W9WI09_9ACTN|nr:hypothetical protein [Streptomyces paradoxus]MBB6079492.1 hypothetical protein [Streptomyces paradoxus]
MADRARATAALLPTTPPLPQRRAERGVVGAGGGGATRWPARWWIAGTYGKSPLAASRYEGARVASLASQT